jgi:hypothetical protein
METFTLIVYGTDGNTYNYGVFCSRPAAIEFAKRECNGFRFEVQRLICVHRIGETYEINRKD